MEILTDADCVITSAIGVAIGNGDTDLVSKLVKENIRILTKKATESDKVGVLNRHLQVAASLGRLEIVKLYVSYGGNLNSSTWDDETETAITTLFNEGDKCIEIVRYFLDSGAQINFERNGKLVCPALHDAAIGGALEGTKLLVERGACLNGLSKNGLTAFDFATMYKHKSVAEYLASKGALPGYQVGGYAPMSLRPPAGSFREHLERYLGPADNLSLQQLIPSGVSIRIYRFDRGEEQFLITEGMASFAMPIDGIDIDGFSPSPYSELLLRLPSDWPLTSESMGEQSFRWPIEWLFKIAAWPSENNRNLGPATVFANGEPSQAFASNTELCCIMAIQAGFDFTTYIHDNKEIRIYLLVPIYREERDFESDHGALPLLNELRDADIPLYVDPKRRNVAAQQL